MIPTPGTREGNKFWSMVHGYEVGYQRILEGAPTMEQQSTEKNRLSPKKRKHLVKALRRIHGDNCYYCGVLMSAPTVEHLVNVSDGGGHDVSNLVLAHELCNFFVGNARLETKLKLHELTSCSNMAKLHFIGRARSRHSKLVHGILDKAADMRRLHSIVDRGLAAFN